MADTKQTAPKPPKSILIYTYMTCFLPYLMFLLGIHGAKYITPEETAAFHSSIPMLFCNIFMLVMPGVFYSICMKKSEVMTVLKKQ